MVDGKDELAMDQLGAVSGGTKGRLVEVDITKPVTTVPTAPTSGAYSLSQYGVEQTHVTANATLRAEASEFDPKRRSRLIQFENEKL